MLLATYQPLVEDKSKREKHSSAEFVEELGYYPYFCFPAETIQDAVLYSVLSAPNCPERIIFFTADEYDTIDIVNWNLYIATKDKKYLKDLINTDSSKKYKEYLVQEIKNIVCEVDIKNCIEGKIGFLNEDGEIEESVQSFYDMLAGLCMDYKSRVELITDDEESKKFAEKRINKEVFQIYMLPFISVEFAGEGDLTTQVDATKYHRLLPKISEMLTRFYNEEENMQYKTKEYYDKICEIINTCIVDVRWDMEHIGRNDPCYCGSGKKYKWCHGKY